MVTKKNKSLLKRVGVIVGLVTAIILFIAGVSDSFTHAKVGIKKFDKKFGGVTSSVRQSLYREIEKVSQLNSGKKKYDAKFVLRDDGSEVLIENEAQSYGSMYVDSESLQISLFVQINWGAGFSAADESFEVRVECADEAHWRYETNHCVTIRTDESLEGYDLENFRILESYGLNEVAASEYRKALLAYFKNIDANAKTMLFQPASINVSNSEISAKLELDYGKTYELKLDSESNRMTVSENGAEIWRYDSTLFARTTRHPLLVQNYLPVELSTEEGTDFALRWVGDNKLKISPDYCKGSDTNERLIERAKEWLKAQSFAPEEFDISMMKSCAQ